MAAGEATDRPGRQLPYVPALDGLRAVAVLVVMASHTTLPVRGGSVGVDVFFALSGFLITSLLLREHQHTGRIALRAFLLRRLLRLYPALLALAAALTLYALLTPHPVRGPETLAGVFPALLYVGNWVRALDGLGHLGLLEHTWSLAVEEQFYLLWPLVLWATLALTRRLAAVAVVAVTGSVASLVVRLFLTHDANSYGRIANGLDTQADNLLAGCAAAVLVACTARSALGATVVRRASAWLVGPSALLLTIAALYWPHHGDTDLLRAAMTGLAVAAGVLVTHVYVAREGRLARLLSWAPITYTGRRSHGLYLMHYPAFVVLFNLGLQLGGWRTLALGFGTSLLAELSYRYVERPFLRLKDRIGPA
ncbi:acyltransferase [Modestobacter sp. DSM 44400]|uniref:acyltransferase family protein n=1 Tax=Modestobacter sp. DSM 44400 TaxID=1550230 RepID=UPI001587F2AD|nr:acyltransferase [Modestobacter sp. DSM 44400]